MGYKKEDSYPQMKKRLKGVQIRGTKKVVLWAWSTPHIHYVNIGIPLYFQHEFGAIASIIQKYNSCS